MDRFKRIFSGLIFILIIFNAPPSIAAEEVSIWKRVGMRFDFDPLLLYSIALQESRKYNADKKTVRAWPWTLHTKKYGSMYFETYEKAKAKLEKIIFEEKIQNVDIGLMQINWHWNGYLYPDPGKLLMKHINITVAAKILSENLRRHGTMEQAIARYHSADKDRGTRYAISVLSIYEQLQLLPSLAHMKINKKQKEM